jgi:putative SOS response-associated peptidase YedK
MCGRYVSASPPDELARYFSVDEVSETLLEPRYNVAPTDDVAGVFERRGDRKLDVFKWGLVPHWADDPSIGNRMINARAESLRRSNAFRRAFERRRCIIPADGFYEWQPRTGSRRKQPFFIRRRDGEPLAMAGLWEVWHPPGEGEEDGEGELLFSCTIVTGDANELVAPIHDRMPVILPPSEWEAWLDRENHDVRGLQRLLVPAPADLFEAYEVGTDVNTVGNDGPKLIERVEPDREGEVVEAPRLF